MSAWNAATSGRRAGDRCKSETNSVAGMAEQTRSGSGLLRGPFDHHVLRRHVLVKPLVARGHALDLVDDLRPARHAAENAVAPSFGVRRAIVEEGVVGNVDEELRRGRMRIGGPRHGHRVALVL